MSNTILEASPSRNPNPIQTDSLKTFFENINVGDNLYIKRKNGDNINISIKTKKSPYSYIVKKGSNEFTIKCVNTPQNTEGFVVSEYDTQSNKFIDYEYSDILSISSSNKKSLSNVVFSKNFTQPTQQPQQPQQNNTTQQPNNTQQTPINTSDGGMDTEGVLARLKELMNDYDWSLVNAYKRGLKAVKNVSKRVGVGTLNSFKNSLSNNPSASNITTNFVSLSRNMTYKDDAWVTLSKTDDNYITKPQIFSADPNKLKQMLKDVLFVISTGDELTLKVTSTENYLIKPVVRGNQLIYLKDVTPNRKVTNPKSPSTKMNISDLVTDYTQPDTIRISNRNKLVLPLFVGGISEPNKVFEITGIHSFEYLVKQAKYASEAFTILRDSFTSIFENLSDDMFIKITYKDYSDIDSFTPKTITIKIKKKKDLFVIDECELNQLIGLSLNADSLVYSFDGNDLVDGGYSGLVLQTQEGTALGNITDIRELKANGDGTYGDASDTDDVTFTDEELYQTVMADQTLRKMIIRKPSFWEWLKHKKNNFNGVTLDVGVLKAMSDRLKDNSSAMDSELDSKSFFNLTLVDDNGLDGTYANGFRLKSGMNLLVKVVSSNNKTKMFTYKTQYSKPSLVLQTDTSVFDVSNNEFTSKSFTANVSDGQNVVGKMSFKLNN